MAPPYGTQSIGVAHTSAIPAVVALCFMYAISNPARAGSGGLVNVMSAA
jgi:hypothetical protein